MPVLYTKIIAVGFRMKFYILSVIQRFFKNLLSMLIFFYSITIKTQKMYAS